LAFLGEYNNGHSLGMLSEWEARAVAGEWAVADGRRGRAVEFGDARTRLSHVHHVSSGQALAVSIMSALFSAIIMHHVKLIVKLEHTDDNA
jgi:hypothetical protein